MIHEVYETLRVRPLIRIGAGTWEDIEILERCSDAANQATLAGKIVITTKEMIAHIRNNNLIGIEVAAACSGVAHEARCIS